MSTRLRRTVLSAALVASLVLAGCSGGEEPVVSANTLAPAPVGSVDVTAAPQAADAFVATAVPQGEIQFYDAPGGAPTTTLPNPRLINGDPNAAVPLTLLVKEQGEDFHEVYLPIRPNGSTGWVKASDVTLKPTNYRIEVSLSAFNLKVWDGDTLVSDFPIATADESFPTPPGRYFITELLQTPNPNGAYGPYAYGLSGFSEVLTSFNGGPGQLGIHGTNKPELIGTQASSGCIRLRNEDITTLVDRLPLGTPVNISA